LKIKSNLTRFEYEKFNIMPHFLGMASLRDSHLMHLISYSLLRNSQQARRLRNVPKVNNSPRLGVGDLWHKAWGIRLLYAADDAKVSTIMAKICILTVNDLA
jgi:hypothetical protein